MDKNKKHKILSAYVDSVLADYTYQDLKCLAFDRIYMDFSKLPDKELIRRFMRYELNKSGLQTKEAKVIDVKGRYLDRTNHNDEE